MPDRADASLADLHSLVEHCRQAFAERFGQPADHVVAAPGRVNLIGEHIDYNDGFVLPMAIQRYIVFAASVKNTDGDSHLSTVHSINLGATADIDLAQPPPPVGEWTDYLSGVAAGFQELKIAFPAFNAVFASSVPLGGGLSSSAALEVATATLLEALSGQVLDRREKALLCQRAEHRYAGVPCGIMDQFSSVFGEPGALMLLDCRTQEIEAVKFAADNMTVLITNSNVKHELSGGEYGQRRAQCDAALKKLPQNSWRDVRHSDLMAAESSLTEDEFKRARHVVSEIARTLKAVECFRAGQWRAAGELMLASHVSLRDDYEVSCPELDTLAEIATEIGTAGGVWGSRMTGGGFGGCTVTLVDTNSVAAVQQQIESQYQARTGIQPASFSTRPARGAHVVS